MNLSKTDRTRIIQSVAEEEVVRVLQDLIRFKTVNPPGNEKECCEYIADYLRDAGGDVELHELEKDRPNVVAVAKGSERSPRLLLNGHVDVVAAGEDWTVDPFGGIVQDGKVYGRGASDMKSGVAASMVAMKVILQEDVKLKGDLVLEAVADEESLGPAGTRHLLDKGIRADMAIVTEPTDLRIDIAQRGILWLQVDTKGRAAHGGRPWVGVSAIYQMVDFLNRLKQLEKNLSGKKHELLTSPSFNVGTIEGGNRINVVPSNCRIQIDRRLVPCETIEEAVREITTILKDAKAKDSTFEADHKVLLAADPFETPRDHPLVKALQEATYAINNQEAQIGGKDAGTDGAWLAKAGIPTVLYGPGQYLTAHTANEYAEIDKLVRGTRTLAIASCELLK